MNSDIYDYYSERAAEYDELYLCGGASASISDPAAYKSEALAIGRALPRVVGPGHLDLACGTGFWLQFYGPSCHAVTLIDQAPEMLSRARERAESLDLAARCDFVRGNVLEQSYGTGVYDSALMGFLMSHLTEDQGKGLLAAVRASLRPGGRLVLIDSVWSAERANTRSKSGMQTRRLNDGRAFEIFKRYFTEEDLLEIGEGSGFRMRMLHNGRVFLCAAGYAQ